MSTTKPNNITHLTIGRTLRAIRLETASLVATILLDQGADILELRHKQTGTDVLWKVPYPVREPGVGPTPAGDSYAQWMHFYRGGWQTIFPNFGPAVKYRDAMLDFHGEAARRPWQLESEICGADVAVEVSTELSCLPLAIKRRFTVSGVRPELAIAETASNSSDEAVDCMWVHHPVFGAPLLSPQSRIYTGARLIHTDDSYDVPANDLPLGKVFEWPLVTARRGGRVDLSRIPAPGSGLSRLVFLEDFEQPWCAMVNPDIPLGVALRWNGELMRYMCLWQETGGHRDFPHFAKTYATALEPSTSLFGHGLLDAIENTHTQLTLPAGESRTLQLKAILFSDRRPLRTVTSDGELEFRSGQ
jgi:hypothetical protein